MESVIRWITGLSGPLVYAVVALMVFGEDALFVGFVLPGETSVVIGGTIAAAHRGVSLPVLMVVVAAAAALGDAVGYGLGRFFGPWLLRTRTAARNRVRIERARAFIQEKGPTAVFFARFVAFLRTLVPTLAGISRMPYGRFTFFNVAADILWGVGNCLLGFAAGAAYARVEKLIGTVLTVTIGVLLLAALAVWLIRRRLRPLPDRDPGTDRPGRDEPGTDDGDDEDEGDLPPRRPPSG